MTVTITAAGRNYRAVITYDDGSTYTIATRFDGATWQVDHSGNPTYHAADREDAVSVFAMLTSGQIQEDIRDGHL